MPTVLQLRGINCSGKTTACYQYVEKHGPAEAYDVWAGDKYLPVTVTDDAVMLGDYTVRKQTAGADCYQSNKRLFAVLEEVMHEWPDRDIVFEGYIFGKSIKLAVDLDRFCKDHGYSYTTLWLWIPFEEVERRLSMRKGNGRRNWNAIHAAMAKLDRMQPKVVVEGVSSPVEDTSTMPVCEMHRLIEGYLRWR